MPAERPPVQVIVATDGPPWADRTWSGSSRALCQALDQRGALAAAIDVRPRALDAIEKAASFSLDRTAWRQRYWSCSTPLSPAVRGAMSRIGARRVQAAKAGAALLQISGWYDARPRTQRPPVFATYQDANLALWLRRPDLRLNAGDRRLRRTLREEGQRYRSMDVVLTMSDWTRQSFIEDFDVPAGRVRTVGAGANLSHIPEPVHRPDGPPRLLFVGRNFERKGGPALLDAFAQMRTQVKDAELAIVGPAPGATQPGVHWHGPVNRSDQLGASLFDRLMREATIFVLPSLYEGFGMPLLEAMAYGLPCVASNRCALPEIVVDQETGLLCEPDPDDLAERLTRLSGDPTLARRMGHAGRARALNHFTWDSVAGRVCGALAQG